MIVLKASKTKMIRLAKAMGYDPPQNAGFIKAYRARTWWLVWDDNRGSYEAVLSTAAGRAFFGMRYQAYDCDAREKWKATTLSLDDLKKFELVTALTPHSSNCHATPEPGGREGRCME